MRDDDDAPDADLDAIDVSAARGLVDGVIDDTARQALADADAVRMARARADVIASRGGACTLAAVANEMQKARKKPKGERNLDLAAPIVGPLASALSATPAPAAEPIDISPYLPSRTDRPEWYEPDPLLGGHCIADVLQLAADRETASTPAMCRELGISSRQWSAWILCAPRETADLVRRLQRIGLADAGVDRLRELLGDEDPYVQLGAIRMAVVDLDPERHAGSLHKDAGLESLGSGGPRQIIIQIGADMRTV